MKNNNKGMTVIEVLIAIAIISIVICVTYSVYIANAKHIWREELEAKLQNEAQIIEATFSQLSMQTKGIEDKESSSPDKDNYYNINNLAMKSEDKIFNWIINNHELRLNVVNNEDGTFKEYSLSKNIEVFRIRPIDENSLEDAKIIEVLIDLRKQKGFNDIIYPISMIITFRNK